VQALRAAKWIALDRLCLADLPDWGGDISGCYVFRRAASGEVVYIGSTDTLRRRLFGNYLGGVGGSTTKRIHAALFEPEVLAGIEVAWIVSEDWQALETELKRQFAMRGGPRLPIWVKR
jgi:excinuclease UvrABC nuclease subunit